MKKITTVLAMLFIYGLGYAQLPFINEDFFGSGIPDGWTSNRFFRQTTGGVNNSPAMRGNAFGNEADERRFVSLQTRPIDMGNNPMLSFSYRVTGNTAGTTAAAANTFEFTVSITKDGGETWSTVLQQGPNAEVTSTTYQQIIVDPIELAEFIDEICMVRIEFMSIAPANVFVWIDDVKIGTLPTDGFFEGAATLSFGTAINNIPNSIVTRQYAVANKGLSPLTITEASVSGSEITVSGLPLTLEIGGRASISIDFDAYGFYAEPYTGEIVFTTNDPLQPEVTVEVTASVEAEFISAFIFENFSRTLAQLQGQEGWAFSRFTRVDNGTGMEYTPALRVQLFGAQATTTRHAMITSPYVWLGPNPTISFWYRFSGNINNVNAPANANTFEYMVSITKDYGVTWDTIHISGPNPDASDFVFRKAVIDVDESFRNEIVMVRIHFSSIVPFLPPNTANPNIAVWVDDITIGTFSENDLAAISIDAESRSAVVGTTGSYTVTIRNEGPITQTDYTVKLMLQVRGGGDDIELASLPGVEIAQGDTRVFEFEWTPQNDGIARIYGKVVMDNDENSFNDRTPLLRIDVHPAGIHPVQIGTGANPTLLPFDFFMRNSITQVLYYPQELGINRGLIAGLAYQSMHTTTLGNKHVQIWLGETDKADLTENWIDPQDFVLVFDDVIHFTEGENVVFVPFDIPYNYQGGNLVVQALKLDNTSYAENQVFFRGTSSQGTNRSRRFRDHVAPIDPMNPQFEGSSLHGAFPNTTIMFFSDNWGSLSGVVSHNGVPVEGVQLRPIGYQIIAATNANGEYVFPNLDAGNYQIEVKRIGYITDIIDVIIIAGEEVVLDINFEQMPSITVSGTITGNNAPDGLENVTITITGYDNFSTTTNADGQFSIPNVWQGHEYTITASLFGYTTIVETLTAGTTDITHNIELIQRLFPVTNQRAEVAGDGNKVEVTWSEPVGAVQTTFRKDAGINNGQIGFTVGGNIFGVIGTAWREIATLERMSWFLTANGGYQTQVNVFVFALDDKGMPTNTIIYSAENVPTTVESWSEYVFSEPVYAPNGFLLALSRRQGFLSLGTSELTQEFPFYRQTHFSAFDYRETGERGFAPFETFPPRYVTLMLRAEGISEGRVGDLGTLTRVSSIKQEPSSMAKELSREGVSSNELLTFIPSTPKVKEFELEPRNSPESTIEYVIYRFLDENTDESTWTILGTTSETAFVDSEWKDLPAGFYRYAIRAKYAGGHTSIARITNAIPLGMTVSFTVNITTNTGISVNGATVTLVNQSNNTEHVYTQTATSNAVTFPAVWRGVYNISVVKRGFLTYRINDVEINIDGGYISVELKENIIKPFNLDVVVDGANATLSWNQIENFFDDMESHEDFIINNIGDYILYDGDGAFTFHFRNGYFENQGSPFAYIVFNPSRDPFFAADPHLQPHSGNKFLASFSPISNQNDDWLIIPKRQIVDGMILNFWAKTYTPEFNLERFQVGVSTTNSDPASFTFISLGDYVEVPTEWTEFTFDLSYYAGQKVYVAIRCVSYNAFVFMLDDIFVGIPDFESYSHHDNFSIFLNDTEIINDFREREFTFTNLPNGEHIAGVQAIFESGASEVATISFTIESGVSIEVTNIKVFTVSPNPVTDELNIQTEETIIKIEMIDLTGSVIQTWHGNRKSINIQSVPAGSYILRIHTENAITPVRIVKK